MATTRTKLATGAPRFRRPAPHRFTMDQYFRLGQAGIIGEDQGKYQGYSSAEMGAVLEVAALPGVAVALVERLRPGRGVMNEERPPVTRPEPG